MTPLPLTITPLHHYTNSPINHYSKIQIRIVIFALLIPIKHTFSWRSTLLKKALGLCRRIQWLVVL
jgi:hypothetical protein